MRPYQDRLAKRGLQFLADGGSLEPLGLGRLGRIVGAEAPEGLVVHSRTADYLLHMDSGARVAVEHVSGAVADLYASLGRLAVHVEHLRGPVHLMMLYTGAARPAPEQLEAGGLLLRALNVFTETLDGDALLDRFRRKLAAGGVLDKDDAMGLSFVGVMGHRRRGLAVAVGEALRYAGTLEPEADREGCAAAVLLLGRKRLTEDEMAGLVEVFAMAAPSMARILEERGRAAGKAQGQAEGKAEGKAEGRAEDILRVLRLRCGETGEAVAARVRGERDFARLERWIDVAATCASLAEFEAAAFGTAGGAAPRP